MKQLLAILILILAALPQMGFGTSSEPTGSGCAQQTCHAAVVVTKTCCGTMMPAKISPTTQCPMSGGACRCITAPVNNSTPSPQAPPPTTGPKIVLGLSTPTPTIEFTLDGQPAHSRITAGLVASLTSLYTHNEKQALLGIWRT